MKQQDTIPALQPEAFENALHASRVVVIEFWASWCTPCEKMHAIFSQLAAEMENRAAFFRMNADECRALVERLNIVTLPTTVIFCDGVEAERTTGPKAKPVLRSLVEHVI